MFSLEEFRKFVRKKNRLGFVLFIFTFFSVGITFSILKLNQYKILFLLLFIAIYLISYNLLTRKIDNNFVKKHSDILSFIFLREFTGDKKYDIQKNFKPNEIEDFIKNLNCQEYSELNKIPSEYFYVKNKNYLILKFDEDYLQHYTRKIKWEDISWKYAFVNNDGIYENLSLEYYDKENERIINSEIITDDIQQKPFHIFILFLLYDLKYGKRLSLSKKNYKKRFPFKFLGLSFRQSPNF